MRSHSLQSWYKEQKKIQFREKIRADAEALKQRELLLREEKKKVYYVQIYIYIILFYFI
jgi:hypothetical protein